MALWSKLVIGLISFSFYVQDEIVSKEAAFYRVVYILENIIDCYEKERHTKDGALRDAVL